MADDVEPLDPTLCANPDSPGECCSGSFDYKTAPGLCARCYIATKDATRAEVMKVCFYSILCDLNLGSQYFSEGLAPVQGLLCSVQAPHSTSMWNMCQEGSEVFLAVA
jgi:hypothetical protein